MANPCLDNGVGNSTHWPGTSPIERISCFFFAIHEFYEFKNNKIQLLRTLLSSDCLQKECINKNVTVALYHYYAQTQVSCHLNLIRCSIIIHETKIIMSDVILDSYGRVRTDTEF